MSTWPPLGKLETSLITLGLLIPSSWMIYCLMVSASASSRTRTPLMTSTSGRMAITPACPLSSWSS